MNSPWLGLGLVVVILASALGGLSKISQRSSLHPEVTRKAMHVLMGLVCLSFPWLFSEAWPVILLGVMAVGGLWSIRISSWLRQRWGGVLGGVNRQSWGELYFPLAIVAVFLLADGQILFYIIPVLTLTVADAVGALVGMRYGLSRYQTDDGYKSAEGSMAFFIATFLATHVPLLLFSTIGRAECLLIGLTVGMLVTLIEAVSWKGIDNLFIPLGVFYLLEVYQHMESGLLILRLGVLMTLTFIALFWRFRTTLNGSATLAAALCGYGLWALGGWTFLIGPLLLFLIYILLPGFTADKRPMQNLHAVTQVMAGAYLYLLIALQFDPSRGWLGYHICLACHAANIINARLRAVRPHFGSQRVLMTSGCLSVVIFFLSGIWILGKPSGELLLLAPAIAISLALFHTNWFPGPNPNESRTRRWLAEVAVAPIAACLVWFLSHSP